MSGSINGIISECLDQALASFDFADKKIFYEYLKEKHKINSEQIAEKFEQVHAALKEVYGNNHFKIERAIIKTLNQGAKDGTFERSTEIAAFSLMVNVFILETEKNIKMNKETKRITQHAKQLEGEIKEVNEKLKNTERFVAIGETAAMVGHDIRNPLQAIVGELFLQKQDIESIQDNDIRNNLKESVKNIEENIFYINKIVSDLQDFAKPILAGKDEVVDVNTAISGVMEIVPIPPNVQVEINVEEVCPLVLGNAQMLKRALSNLVQNGVQAMPNGGKLTVKAYSVQDHSIITVEDTGDGISEEAKARLFKPLFTTKAKGQGLGLAVVKRLVEAQGGKVWFESDVGKGAKFLVELKNKNNLQ